MNKLCEKCGYETPHEGDASGDFCLICAQKAHDEWIAEQAAKRVRAILKAKTEEHKFTDWNNAVICPCCNCVFHLPTGKILHLPDKATQEQMRLEKIRELHPEVDNEC